MTWLSRIWVAWYWHNWVSADHWVTPRSRAHVVRLGWLAFGWGGNE